MVQPGDDQFYLHGAVRDASSSNSHETHVLAVCMNMLLRASHLLSALCCLYLSPKLTNDVFN